jgi:hypothetical protein
MLKELGSALIFVSIMTVNKIAAAPARKTNRFLIGASKNEERPGSSSVRYQTLRPLRVPGFQGELNF